MKVNGVRTVAEPAHDDGDVVWLVLKGLKLYEVVDHL